MPTETGQHHSATGVASYNAEFLNTLGSSLGVNPAAVLTAPPVAACIIPPLLCRVTCQPGAAPLRYGCDKGL